MFDVQQADRRKNTSRRDNSWFTQIGVYNTLIQHICSDNIQCTETDMFLQAYVT